MNDALGCVLMVRMNLKGCYYYYARIAIACFSTYYKYFYLIALAVLLKIFTAGV
jgi:hypothetical protein